MVRALPPVCKMPGRSPPSLPTARDRVQARRFGRPPMKRDRAIRARPTPAKKGRHMSRHPAGDWRTRVRLTGRSRTRWPSASAMTARGAVSLSTNTGAWRRTLRTGSPTASTSPPSDGQTGTDTRASPPASRPHCWARKVSHCPSRAPARRWPAPRSWTSCRPVPGPPASCSPPHLFQEVKGTPVPCRLHQDRQVHAVRVVRARLACTQTASELRERSRPLLSMWPKCSRAYVGVG